MCTNCNCPESTEEVVYNCESTVCEESYPAGCTQYTDGLSCTTPAYTYTLPTNSLVVGTVVPTSETSTDKTLIKVTENIKDNFCFILSTDFICQMMDVIVSPGNEALLCKLGRLIDTATTYVSDNPECETACP